MTICIAAACENRTKGIVASDRMVTERRLSIEFEHGEKKFELLTKKCVALAAGEALLPTDIFRDVKAKAPEETKIKEIAKTTAEAFRAFKKQRIEDLIMKQRGLTIDTFLKRQRTLLPDIAVRIDQQISTFKINLTLLLTGVDETGAHIFCVIDPGHHICFDRLGFHAIGSGLPHALSTFISHGYTSKKSLKQAAYIVYEAKRNAEKAPGVGKELDMAIVDNTGIRDISEKDLGILEEAHKERTAVVISQSEKMEEVLNSLKW